MKELAVKSANGEELEGIDGELSEDELFDVAGGGWTLAEVVRWFESW